MTSTCSQRLLASPPVDRHRLDLALEAFGAGLLLHFALDRRFVESTAYTQAVFARDRCRPPGQARGESAIGDEDLETAVARRQWAHRDPAPAADPRQPLDRTRRIALGVGAHALLRGAVVSDALVRHVRAAAEPQAPAIETHVVAFIDGLAGFGRLAVDGDAPCRDPGLDLAARPDTAGGEDFLDAFTHGVAGAAGPRGLSSRRRRRSRPAGPPAQPGPWPARRTRAGCRRRPCRAARRVTATRRGCAG